MLEALTGKEHIEIAELVLQLNLQSGNGVKSHIPDSYAVDTEGNVYNLEPQRVSSQANDNRGTDHLVRSDRGSHVGWKTWKFRR